MATESEFKLHYDVPEHEIDSQTFVDSLIGITNIIQEANKQLDPSRRINVRVKALGTGSFVVHLELLEANVLNAIKSMFIGEAIAYISGLAGIAAFALQYHTWRKQDKQITPKVEGETLTIEASDGSTVTIEKNTYEIVVNNEIIFASAEKTLQALSENDELDGFQILGREEKPLFQISGTELRMIAASTSSTVQEEIASRTVTRQTTLAILKVNFERRLKWDFGYLGIKISALVTDNEFWGRVESTEERFAKGDELECELQIGEEYDSKNQGYIAKGYEVVKVIRHIPKSNPQLSIEP